MHLDLQNLAWGSPVFGLALLGVALILGLGVALVRLKSGRLPHAASDSFPDEKAQANPNAVVFPPSRRAALATLLPGTKAKADISTQELRKKQLPSTRTQDLGKKNQYTPTSISTQEIEALGRFPDYSVLSGVPHPEPLTSFDIKTAKFRPFRPFRWTYHQTMALMKMEPDYWVELEHNYFKRMTQRMELYKEHGEKVMFWAPGSELASRELMEMVVQNICIRYPQYFQLEKDNTLLRNRLLDTVTDISSMPPLQVLFNNVPEDFAVMCRSEDDGMYYLRSAMICSSVGWNVGLHKNKILRRIHDNVPQWEEKMAFSVDRWFTKLPVDQPVQRCSWGIEDWEAFFCPEDAPRSAFHEDPSACKIEDLQLRCDWQTLRRLPLSGAVVFNFKAVFTPLAELASEPYIPSLLLRVLQQSKRDLLDYKMEPHVERLSIEACENWVKKQEEDGIVPADWEVGTLEEHPYYPGWKDRGDFGACPASRM